MATDNHTDITSNAPANASTFNTPLGQLDAAIGALTGLPTTPKTSVVGALGTTALGTTATTFSGAIAEILTRLAGSVDADGTLKAGAVDAAAVLAANVVETAKILDNAVTADKIADNVIGSGYVAGTNRTLETLDSLLPLDLGVTELLASLVYAIADKFGVTAFGITNLGDLLLGRMLSQVVSSSNANDLTVALTDASGRLAFGAGPTGVQIGNEFHIVGDPSAQDMVWGIEDNSGRLAVGITRDGRIIGDLVVDRFGADINHVLTTGQSLSVGVNSSAVLSTTQSYGNYMFTDTNYTSFAPLVAPITNAYNANSETIHPGMAAMITDLAFAGSSSGRQYNVLNSLHGKSGQAYAYLKKGGTGGASNGFALGMAQVRAAADLAQRAGRSHQVTAVCVIHGEADHTAGTTNYEACLQEWQSDYNNDIRGITGQHNPVKMLLCQMSSWTSPSLDSATTSLIPYAQLAAAENNPGKIFCVGPKYFLPYQDGLHLTNHGYRQLGEYYGKVYHRVVIEAKSWIPLSPKSITRSGAVITAVFNVPVAPLVLDTTHVTDPGNYGFEYTDDGTPPAISSVVLDGPCTVVVTLASTPTGANQKLRYAYTGTAGAAAGATTGARGCLRDSDPTPSKYGYHLYNWCVHFDKAIS